MDIRITKIATANPRLVLRQSESFKILPNYRKLSKTEGILYKKFLLDRG